MPETGYYWAYADEFLPFYDILMYWIILFIFLMFSCSAIRNTSDRLEESHNALYKQKALLVYAVKNNRVWLTTPTYTRCYYLKGKEHTLKWEPGDTLIIDENLDDFYDLKFAKECEFEHTYLFNTP